MAAMNSSAGEDLEVFLVAPMGHGGAIEDLAGILDIGMIFLFREGVSKDIFRQGLLTVPVVSGDAVSGMHAEAAVTPVHQFFDEPVVYPGSGSGTSFALALQHGQDLGAEE